MYYVLDNITIISLKLSIIGKSFTVDYTVKGQRRYLRSRELVNNIRADPNASTTCIVLASFQLSVTKFSVNLH